MPRLLKPRSLERNSRNIKGRHERLRVNRVDLAKELEKTSMIGRSHWRHEQDLKSLATLKTYWPLEDQTPVIPTLDATFVSCHLFDVFPTATNKICLFKTIVCIVCIPLYLSYLTPKPLDPIEDEWRWACIFWTDESIGDRPMDSEHGGSHEE